MKRTLGQRVLLIVADRTLWRAKESEAQAPKWLWLHPGRDADCALVVVAGARSKVGALLSLPRKFERRTTTRFVP